MAALAPLVAPRTPRWPVTNASMAIDRFLFGLVAAALLPGHLGRAGGDGMDAGQPARCGGAPGAQALYPAVPPAQARAHPPGPALVRI